MMKNSFSLRQKNNIVCETFPTGSLGCNTSLIYSLTTRECLIIDPGNDPVNLIKKIEDKKLQVKALLHTHAHFDHIGGSQKIKDYFQGAVTMHLHQGDDFLYQLLPQQGLMFGQRVETPGKIDQYLQDNQTFGLEETSTEVGDQGLRDFLETIHTPGHTPGSCSFYTSYFDEPLLFSGDTLFQSSIGRTDLPGGDHQLILKSIKQRLYQLPDETFCIPGHGSGTWIHQEKRTNPFVRG